MDMQTADMVRREGEQAEHVSAQRRVAPLVDVYENVDELMLLMDVPGVEDEGLSIQLDGGKLDLEARQNIPDEAQQAFPPVVFARSFTVPSSIDAARVSAEIHAGVLKIHLPKSEAAKPRRIEVTAG